MIYVFHAQISLLFGIFFNVSDVVYDPIVSAVVTIIIYTWSQRQHLMFE